MPLISAKRNGINNVSIDTEIPFTHGNLKTRIIIFTPEQRKNNFHEYIILHIAL